MGTRKTADHHIPVRFHPGETLKEKMEEMEISVKEFATRIGKPEQMVLELVECRMPVNAEWALLLEYTTGIEAEFWLTKQSNYDLYRLREGRQAYQKTNHSWLNILPVSEMIAHHWVEQKEGAAEMVGELLRFFGVVSVEAWENYYFKQKLRVAFRISLEGTINPYALSTWLRRGEIQAQETYLDYSYSKKALKEKMPAIVQRLLHPTDDILDVMQQILESLGIKLIYTEPLSGVPIKGASRWIYGHPCIQLPRQVETYPSYSQTLLHELAHIYLHGKKDIFLENVGYIPDSPESYHRKEAEADEFVRKWLSEERDKEFVAS